MNESQNQRILKQLSRYACTTWHLIHNLHILRPAARIYELRQRGYNITTRMVKAGNARVALYKLES